jgi:two-component system cell cycle response regulator DivK
MKLSYELSAAFQLDYLGMKGRERQRAVAKRILVVEDNDLNRKLFCDVLRANGFEVEPLADGERALDTARQLSPDLIIMDIQLPHVSGVELIEQAKRDLHLQAIPVLAVTAYAAKGDEEKIRAAGAAGYLAKPVSIMPFMTAVRELLPD